MARALGRPRGLQSAAQSAYNLKRPEAILNVPLLQKLASFGKDVHSLED